MLKVIIFTALLFTSSVAASEEINPQSFKDWLTVSDLLRSKGIEPSSPSWAVITPMCLPLKTTTDQTAYNRCLYEKASDEYDWGYDNKKCTEKSEVKYPNSLLEPTVRSYSVIDSDGKMRVIEEKTREYKSSKELLEARKVEFSDCMENSRWRNSYKWTSGRR